jgi:hypothetical protein
MAEEIADGDFAGDVRVSQLELGKVLLDGVVPGKFALIDEDGDGSGGEGFRVGGDAEEGVGIDGFGAGETADAIALGVHQLAVLDNGDGDAGHLEAFLDAGDPGVEVCGLGQQGSGVEEDEAEKEDGAHAIRVADRREAGKAAAGKGGDAAF